MQTPTIGRIVHYKLTADDAAKITRQREDKKFDFRGNDVKEGDVFPMLITKVWGSDPTSAVNGQAYLDGNDVLWVTSAQVGDQPHQFSWPLSAPIAHLK